MLRLPSADRVVRYSTLQSVVEIGLGSVLHTLHLPFSGHALSLNQGVILTLAARDSRDTLQTAPQSAAVAAKELTGIAGIASLLKGLSPSGKRVTPMIAIAVQGFLFALGIRIGGLRLAGVILGMLGLAVWGVLQPLLGALVIFQSAGILAVQTLADTPYAGWILGALVGLKLAVAVGIGIAAWTLSPARVQRFVDRLENAGRMAGFKRASDESLLDSPFRGATRDIFRPGFLFALFISGALVSVVDTRMGVGLYLAKTVGCAWGLFYLLRSESARRAMRSLLARIFRSSPEFKRDFERALQRIESDRGSESAPPRY